MEPVLHSFAYCLDFLREQVADLTEDQMVAQPNGIKNHPAWVIGHIAFACQLLGRAIGLPHWLPKDWSKRFGTGSTPVADAGLYGSREEILAILAEAQSRMTEAVKQLDDSQLDQPFPVESYRPVFPDNPARAHTSSDRPHCQPHRPTLRLAPRHEPATYAPWI